MKLRAVGSVLAVAAVFVMPMRQCAPVTPYCNEYEVNRIAACLRHATVIESYRGYPYYVMGYAGSTGSPGYSRDECIYIMGGDPHIPNAGSIAPMACSRVNQTFVEGDLGYAQF